jgi:hypothetical protein
MSVVDCFPGEIPLNFPLKSHCPNCTDVTSDLPRTACHSAFVIHVGLLLSSIDSLGMNLVAPRSSMSLFTW